MFGSEILELSDPVPPPLSYRFWENSRYTSSSIQIVSLHHLVEIVNLLEEQYFEYMDFGLSGWHRSLIPAIMAYQVITRRLRNRHVLDMTRLAWGY